MAPAKGNKFAVGHGRPANEGYDDAALKQLGEELLAWMRDADEKQLPIVHLSQWWSKIKKIKRSQWESIIKRECFLGYYDEAILWMGCRILLGATETAYGSRFLAVYFSDLRSHEREKKREEIDYEMEKKAELDKRNAQYPNDSRLDELIKSVKEGK